MPGLMHHAGSPHRPFLGRPAPQRVCSGSGLSRREATLAKRARKLINIGWREWLALPDLGVGAVKAKVDTGARTSALHAFDVETFERGGEKWVRFAVHPVQRDTETTVEAEAPLADVRWVRSSDGRRSRRPVIRTRIRLAGVCWTAEITLVRRDLMGFRMLLGRQALRRRFVIDPGRSFLAGRLTKEPK